MLPSQSSSVMLADWRPGSNSYLGVVTQIRGLFACPHPGGMSMRAELSVLYAAHYPSARWLKETDSAI
jgi:hypothetical protein